MPFHMFNIMEGLFPIMFIVILGFIVFVVVRGIAQWSHNNAQPKIPAEARITAKRMSVSHHHHNTGDASGAMHMSTSTTYYVTFEFAGGDRMELRVPDREYGLMAEGDHGVVTFQGTRFIGFERR